MKTNGNEFLPNYVEYLVPLSEAKRLLPKKIGIVALCFVLFLAVVLASFTILETLPVLIPVLLFGIGVLAWYLWRFVSVEYEYTVLQGEMSFDVIYGRRQRKSLYNVKLKNVVEMAPVSETKRAASDFQGITREFFFAGALSRPNTWYAIAEEEQGIRTLFFFEMTEKTEKVLRFYNPRAFLSR